MVASPYVLKQVTQQRYDEMQIAYAAFLAVLNDPKSDPVNIYLPRNEKMLKELELIREISKDLMQKKEEDAMKAAQAAQQAEEKTEEVEEKPEADESKQEQEKKE